jgi:D-alanine-D-alanine ligase
MKKKIRIGVIFGGKSSEHEVSLQSAKNIIDALDRDKYEVVLIGIDKTGKWYLNNRSKYLLNENNPKLIKLNKSDSEVTIITDGKTNRLINLTGNQNLGSLDVIFPVLHGPFGEDGTIQGMLKLSNIPFVGAGVLGSAIGMDKDVMKRLLRDAGIPTADFLVFNRITIKETSFEDIKGSLQLPFFVKPANCGSSVGISKVHNEDEYKKAIDEAFLFDSKIIIEESVQGREIECSVLGNDEPIASLPGEIIPKGEFYSYKAKYIDEDGAALEIPARIDKNLIERIKTLSIKAFQALCCEGMARVDMFLKSDGEILINEINTIPGFTKISMYPKLWEASGIPYSKLIDKLIELAIERFEKEQKIKSSYEIER